jgi:hypothetical protein
MIDSSLISVVVQGPVQHTGSSRYALPTTFLALRNLRRLLPDAEIIFSTWKGEDTRLLDSFDSLIESMDPGPQGSGTGLVPSNINRQIVSTCAGLAVATRKYILKIRSDIILEGLDFIGYFEKAQLLDKERPRLFRSRVVCNNLSSRAPLSKQSGAYLFHPADHTHFGLAEDIKTLWTVPLQSEQDGGWFGTRGRPDNLRLAELSRYAPEQHLWISALRENGLEICLRDYAEDTAALRALSEELLDSHFVFVPDALMPYYFSKYHTLHHMSYEGMRKNSLPSLGIFSVKIAWRALFLKALAYARPTVSRLRRRVVAARTTLLGVHRG